MTQPGWPDRLAHVIAAEVIRYRKQRKLSAQQLSDQCAKLGMEIPRSTLADLENGRRSKVTVAELLVLAQALEVPPMLLVIPLGREQTAEILPGEDVPAWEAALWWRGEGYAIMDLDDGPVLVRHPAPENPVDFVLAHQELAYRWTIAAQAAAEASELQLRSAPGKQRDDWERASGVQHGNALDLEKKLGALRETMRDQGLIPPPLPPGLDRADELAEGTPRTPHT